MSHSITRLSWPIGLAGILVVVAFLLILPPARSAYGNPIDTASTDFPTQATSSFTVALQLLTGGLSQPVYLTHAGDNSGRLFVVEQGGTVRVIKNDALLATPFLDISGQVSCCGEQGLLSIAFDPEYATNGTFYLNYTNLSGDTNVERFVVSSPAADVANVIAATKIITIDQPEANHNGGQLQFGPDGDLYIGMGDGGGAGDQHGANGNGQNPAVLLGKILRVNVRGVPTYTIPPSNPFTQTTGYRPEIWALGLRNPWRFTFDRLNGDMYIGDVGQNCWEEVDYQPGTSHGGENYGWRIMEGFHAFDPANMGNCSQPTITPSGITRPITDYVHDGPCAVTGGYVYRGSAYPQMTGVYFFSDYCAGHIWTEEQISPNTWVSDDKLGSGLQISSFGEDQNGELYVLDIGGQVYKLASAPGLPAPNLSTSVKQASPPNAIFGDTVTYSIVLRNTGAPFSSTMYVTDVVPAGLTYLPGSLSATHGTVNASSAPTLKWTGNMSGTSVITITYAVTVATKVGQTIVNVATVNPVIIPLFTRSASLSIANAPPELSASTKQVSSATGIFGDVLTYTIALRNTGGPFSNTVRVTDTVPIGLNYLPGSFTATRGTVDASSAPMLKWSGVMSSTPIITLTYKVSVTAKTAQTITNVALINPAAVPVFTRSAAVMVLDAPPDLSASAKGVSQAAAAVGDMLTYTVALRNTGGPFTHTVHITDTIPIGLNYLPGSFTATTGSIDDSSAPTLKWSGIMSATPSITLTYVVTVSMLDLVAITNNAIVDPGSGSPFTRSATIVVNGLKAYLPLIFKNF